MSDHDEQPVTPDPPLPAHVPEAPDIEVPRTSRKEQEEQEAAAEDSESEESPTPKEPPD